MLKRELPVVVEVTKVVEAWESLLRWGLLRLGRRVAILLTRLLVGKALKPRTSTLLWLMLSRIRSCILWRVWDVNFEFQNFSNLRVVSKNKGLFISCRFLIVKFRVLYVFEFITLFIMIINFRQSKYSNSIPRSLGSGYLWICFENILIWL